MRRSTATAGWYVDRAKFQFLLPALGDYVYGTSGARGGVSS